MLKEKNKGIDLVIGARTGQYYEESFIKSKLRKVLKKIVEFVAGKPIKDINSGLRIFDKSTVTMFFPRLCNTFSFTTTQTLSYVMNDLSVSYVDINYRKRCGKTKVKLLKDSIKCLKHIFKVGIYYNPFKIYFLLSTTLVFLSIVCIIIYILFFN